MFKKLIEPTTTTHQHYQINNLIVAFWCVRTGNKTTRSINIETADHKPLACDIVACEIDWRVWTDDEWVRDGVDAFEIENTLRRIMSKFKLSPKHDDFADMVNGAFAVFGTGNATPDAPPAPAPTTDGKPMTASETVDAIAEAASRLAGLFPRGRFAELDDFDSAQLRVMYETLVKWCENVEP